MDGSAYRVLGLSARTLGDQDHAARLFRIAARRTPRDLVATHRLFEDALAASRMGEAATHLDTLLRLDATRAPALLASALPYLTDVGFSMALANQLTRNPPWRPLLPDVLAGAAATSHAEALLAQIASAGKLHNDELALHARLLERLGRPLEARSRWRHALPAGLSRLDRGVFDGGFESGGGPAPYGWSFDSPAGTVVGTDLAQSWAGRQSLAVVFDGRAVDFSGVGQDLVLEPGHYRLALQANVALRGSRPLAWQMQCRLSGMILTRLELPAATGGWRGFYRDFDIPAGCTMQRLQLFSQGRDLAQRQVAGDAHFDAISIVPRRNGAAL